jgi:hypothetical protein
LRLWTRFAKGEPLTEKIESAIRRLTKGIEPHHREILTMCLDGSISPAVALTHLLSDGENASVVRATVDQITMRAASLSRAGDNLIRDRVDELTQLMVETELRKDRLT